MKGLEELLTARAAGDPYSPDGSFAANIVQLPPGLRAMAATHWLDISLTLDSITWHFGNFGEPKLVAETEAGLRELGWHDLAACFVEAKELMVPLLAQRTEADGDPYEILERAGLRTRGDELDRRAWALDEFGPSKSVIYGAWIREDAELSVDRVGGGIVRTATGSHDTCPNRAKDPIAWASFQRYNHEPISRQVHAIHQWVQPV